MKKLFFIFILLFNGIIMMANSITSDSTFNKFKDKFVDELWRLNPGWATMMGIQKYDHLLPDNSYETRNLSFISYIQQLKELKQFDINSLSSLNKIDFKIIENFLNSRKFYMQIFKDFEWDPSVYNVAENFNVVMKRKYSSKEEKLQKLNEKLSYVQNYYQTALKNLKEMTREHTVIAITQNKGALSVFGLSFTDSIQNSKLKNSEKKVMQKRLTSAITAINSYIDWLEKVKLPEMTKGRSRSYRIGKEMFEQKFKYEIVSDYSTEQIYHKALSARAEVHQKMTLLTKQLWKKYFPTDSMPDGLISVKRIISKISENHVHRDSFLTAIKKQIPILTGFVNKKNLFTLDPSKPLVVRPTPSYMEGTGAGASINSPGPFETNGETYYNVGLLTDYSEPAAESYLREYNNYTLQILNIHEAIPGHYVQKVYSNNSVSTIKSIFENTAMVEGWAVYSERMMLEEGYGANEPELWLMYYKWFLRVIYNTIIDYEVHTGALEERQALNMLMNEAFQEKSEAEGKWKRARLSSVQLCSYFTGFSEIYDFREEQKKKSGNAFNLKEWHEKFLSFGSAPVPYIKELMK